MDLRCVRENYWRTRWLRKKNREKRKIKMCDWKLHRVLWNTKIPRFDCMCIDSTFFMSRVLCKNRRKAISKPCQQCQVQFHAQLPWVLVHCHQYYHWKKKKKKKKPDQINQSITKNNNSFFHCQTRSNKCDNPSEIANRDMYCHILLKYNRCVSLAYVHCSNLKFVLQVTPSLFICWLQYPKLYTCDTFLPIYSLQSSKIVYKWCLSLAFFQCRNLKLCTTDTFLLHLLTAE